MKKRKKGSPNKCLILGVKAFTFEKPKKKNENHEENSEEQRQKLSININRFISLQDLVETPPVYASKKEKLKRKHCADNTTCHNICPVFTPKNISLLISFAK